MNDESGMSDLFGGIKDSESFINNFENEEDISNSKYEFSALGFYLNSHPVKEHAWQLNKLCPSSIESLVPNNSSRCAGVVIRQNRIQTKRGPLMFATLDDGTDRIELVIPADVLENFEGRLDNKIIYVATGIVEIDNNAEKKNIGLPKKMQVKEIKSLQEVRMDSVNILKINLNPENETKVSSIVENVKSLSTKNSGNKGCRIEMQYNKKGAYADMQVGKDFQIKLTDENLEALIKNFGTENIDFQYRA